MTKRLRRPANRLQNLKRARENDGAVEGYLMFAYRSPDQRYKPEAQRMIGNDVDVLYNIIDRHNISV
jgi:hypothetical protein